LLRSAEALRLDADSARLREVYDRAGTLAARAKTYPITGPVSLVETVWNWADAASRCSATKDWAR
jgi:hypothetical protein